MRLNVEKIYIELARIRKNQSWLADRMGISRQLFNYRIKSENITHAQGFADVLGIDGKDLII